MSTKSQSAYRKEVLLGVVGLTPQVVTETLYALTQLYKRPCPAEIHLITSEEGAAMIKRDLLDPEKGQIVRFCDEYDLDAPRCDASTIHVIRSTDLRSHVDNEGAADTILDVVRKLTADESSRIHFSIAGGRKTMTYYLGYCASMLSRAQDDMSHVMVSDQYDPKKFFPDRSTHPERSGIDLPKVPFIRLRKRLPQKLLNEKRSFSNTVNYINAIEEPNIRLSLLAPKGSKASSLKRTVEVVGGPTLELSPKLFALIWMFARARKRDGGAVTSDSFRKDYLELFLPVYRLTSDEGLRFEKEESVAKDLSLAQFRNRVHKLNQALRDALPWSDESIGVEEWTNGKAGVHRKYTFSLRLPAPAIELEAPDHLRHLTGELRANESPSGYSNGAKG